jgi:hypothetical protein
MKETLKKISDVCKVIFGYGVMISLFGGGLTFFGYVIALIIGGDTAVAICEFMSTYITPNAILLSTVMVLFGILAMYLAGELSLTPTKREKNVKKSEDKK